MTILILGLVIFLGLHSTRIVSERGPRESDRAARRGPLEGDLFGSFRDRLRADRLGIRAGAP